MKRFRTIIGLTSLCLLPEPLNGFISGPLPTGSYPYPSTTTTLSAVTTYTQQLEQRQQNQYFGDPHSSSRNTDIATKPFFWRDPVGASSNDIIAHVQQQLFPTESLERVAERVTIIDHQLPLITIDGFLKDSICEQVIAAAEATGDMKRSTTGSTQNLSTSRTSSTTWLRPDNCPGPALDLLNSQASRLADIPQENFESLQVVKYDGNGQKFDVHTDHMDSFNDLDCFGRLATCLVYLNSASDGFFDDQFSGGSTFFPEFDAYVKPKRGRAVFWFNTIERPGWEGYAPGDLHANLRSRHAGTPVYNGSKYVCNLWMHPVSLR